MAKAGPEMLVITKIHDLAIRNCRHVARFPRSHRFTLGDRLEVRLYQVPGMLIRAKYTRDRAALLRAVNVGVGRREPNVPAGSHAPVAGG
jgi:hypothetical protein